MPNRPLLSMRVQPQEEMKPFVEGRINGGMVTTIDAADIENHQFQLVKNFFVRDDKTFRRFGTKLYTPIKPNSVRVLNIVSIKRFNDTVNIIRLSPSSVHIGTSTTWTLVAPAIALTGALNDRFSTTVINDRFFFANGVDPIQEINFAASTHAVVGDAPNYEFITGFFNRLVGARRSTNPIEVGWSGDNNLAVFNPLTDISAGSTPLIDSPSDAADFITGLFGFANYMLILRERSIWQATKLPSASNPFHFVTAVSGLGCDAPDTATQIPNGVCWFDFRTGSVYAYRVGMTEPEAIGRPVEGEIVDSISDINTLFASYNTVYDEYTLVVPGTDTTATKLWTYNFKTKAWWYESMDSITALANLDYESSSLMIEDLTGTTELLLGMIEDLSLNVEIASRFYGKLLGEIELQDVTATLDVAVAYEAEIISKTFNFPIYDEYIAQLVIVYMPVVAGSMSIYYSKDDKDYVLLKTVSFVIADYGKRKKIVCKKHIKASNFKWRIVSNSGLFELLQYEGHRYLGATSKAS